MSDDAPRMPTLADIDRAQLPAVTPRVSPSVPTAQAETGHAGQLARITGKALDKLEEILDIELNPERPEYGTELRMILMAADKAIQSQLRVEENVLRKQTADTLPRILEAIRRVEQGMPPLPVDRTT